MRIRMGIGRALVRAGRFIQSLAIMVMRPRDLVESTRRAYAGPDAIDGWAGDAVAAGGLTGSEISRLARVPFRTGHALVLGVGGGREAIPLAEAGFEVTGVDFVPELVARAIEFARAKGVEVHGLVQDFTGVDVPAASFDLVWLSSGAYSLVPTRKRRAAFLRRIHQALRPGGYFLCEFKFSPEREYSSFWEVVRRAASWLSLGNLAYERGDRLAPDGEFIHWFASEDEARAEFEGAGFDVEAISASAAALRGDAVLRKLA